MAECLALQNFKRGNLGSIPVEVNLSFAILN